MHSMAKWITHVWHTTGRPALKMPWLAQTGTFSLAMALQILQTSHARMRPHIYKYIYIYIFFIYIQYWELWIATVLRRQLMSVLCIEYSIVSDITLPRAEWGRWLGQRECCDPLCLGSNQQDDPQSSIHEALSQSNWCQSRTSTCIIPIIVWYLRQYRNIHIYIYIQIWDSCIYIYMSCNSCLQYWQCIYT